MKFPKKKSRTSGTPKGIPISPSDLKRIDQFNQQSQQVTNRIGQICIQIRALENERRAIEDKAMQMGGKIQEILNGYAEEYGSGHVDLGNKTFIPTQPKQPEGPKPQAPAAPAENDDVPSGE